LSKDFEEKITKEVELKKFEKRRFRKIKDEDLFETVEEVFDRATLMSLYDLLNRGIIDEMLGVISAGKESRVYWAKSREGDLAVKIYLTSSMEFRKSIYQYIVGDPRFEGVKRETRHMIYTWALKEYKNLEEAYRVGVRVPRPIKAHKNILVMEFLGEDGTPAPLLKDCQLDVDEATRIFNEVLNFIKLLYTKAEIVHADLSEFNMMMWNGKCYFIDFGQAVSIRHPMAQEFLARDIKNVLRFFSESGVEVPSFEEVYKWVVEE